MAFVHCDKPPARKALRKAWGCYRANPSKENRHKYFKVAVPRWRKERDDTDKAMP